MKKLWFGTALLVLASGAGQADILGSSISAGLWDQELTGTVRVQGSDIDVESDLRLGSETRGSFRFTFEHPTPVLPNIRLAHTEIAFGGRSVLTRDFVFRGVPFTATDTVDSNIDFNQTDLTLYYQIVDTVLELDLGMTFKYVNGDVSVRSVSTGRNERREFQELIPLIYAGVGGRLPFTGLSAGVEGSALSYDGHKITELVAQVSYESEVGLGIQGGYRMQQIDLDNLDDVSSDLEISGPFLTVFFHL